MTGMTRVVSVYVHGANSRQKTNLTVARSPKLASKTWARHGHPLDSGRGEILAEAASTLALRVDFRQRFSSSSHMSTHSGSRQFVLAVLAKWAVGMGEADAAVACTHQRRNVNLCLLQLCDPPGQ